jgi:Pectate lyase superfamily protein
MRGESVIYLSIKWWRMLRMDAVTRWAISLAAMVTLIGASAVPAPGISVKSFGAVGDGLANDSSALTACLDASANLKEACHIPEGTTLAVDNVNLPIGAVIRGDGVDKSVILRFANSSSTAGILHCVGCRNVFISDVLIDGNASQETVGAHNIYLINYSNVYLLNVKTIGAAKGGIGLILQNSKDQAVGTTSDMANVNASSNSSAGVALQDVAWRFTATNTVADNNGTHGFYIFQTPSVDQPVAKTLQHISIDGGDFSGNGGDGIAVLGYISRFINGSITQPVVESGIEPVYDLNVTKVRGFANRHYGIALAGRGSSLSNSIFIGNNTGEIQAGGVVSLCEDCTIKNIVSKYNAGGYGLDMGCSRNTRVVGGRFESNTIGINVGCSFDDEIHHAYIAGNTSAGIQSHSAEASGDNYGIPGFTKKLTLSRNHIFCTGSRDFGILVAGGGLKIDILRNYVQGCNPELAIVSTAASGRLEGNYVMSGVSRNADYRVGAASGILEMPDWVSTVRIEGAVTINTVLRASEKTVGTGVSALEMTASGSNYVPVSGGGFTVMGCAVAPTGDVLATRTGELTGVRFATPGSGCISPTISFANGKGGMGILYGAPLSGVRRELTLLVGRGGSLTLSPGGNIVSIKRLVGARPGSVIKFLSADGYLYEKNRAIH